MAIDLQGGDVVRLRQGDFEQVTRYATDPVTLARSLVRDGADWLHGCRASPGAHDAPPTNGSAFGWLTYDGFI